MSEKKSKRSKSKAPKTFEINAVKIGFLGAGKMTECMVDGLIAHAQIEPSKIFVSAPTNKNLPKFAEKGCTVTKRTYDIFSKFGCEVIFLNIHGSNITKCYPAKNPKPYALCTNFIPLSKHPIYIISMINGHELKKVLDVLLNPETKDKYNLESHRIVMNAACANGLGFCAIDVEPDSNKLSSSLRALLGKISALHYVPEEQMDATCAVAGAGLAFVYYFIKALADGAHKMGLDRDMANKLAAKTLECAAKCFLEAGAHPSAMKDAVCAPQGAAIFGLHALDKAEFNSGIIAAVEAAKKRADELAKAESK